MAKTNKKTDSNVKSSYERFASHLVSVVLGALVLWVGQTTFKHNGELSGIRQQIASLEKGQNEITKDVAGRTEGRFTKEDGFRLEQRIDNDLSERFTKEDDEELRKEIEELHNMVHRCQIRLAVYAARMGDDTRTASATIASHD